MTKSTRKLLSIFCIAFFILSIAVPAFAASENSVNKVPQVSDDEKFDDAGTAPFLRIKEKNEGDFTNGDYFELALTNAEWLKDKITAANVVDVTNATVTVEWISKKTLGITIEGIVAGSGKVEIVVPLLTKVTGEGEAKVEVDPRDSAVTGGTYVFALSAEGKTIITVEKVNKLAGRFGELATLRIDETRIGSLGSDDQAIKLKLPPKYSWETTTGIKIDPRGGLAGAAGASGLKIEGTNRRTLSFDFDPTGKTGGARGSIFISGLKIVADRDAAYGDVVLDVDGDKVTATDLLVAKRVDYGVEASVKEVKEFTAGMWDQKTAKIKVEETLEKSLISGREVTVILPEWVKIANTGGLVAITGDAVNGVVGSRQNELYIDVTAKASGKIKYEFELLLSVEADKSGDIVAEFSGAGMETQEVVIGHAVAPITAEVAATDLKIGVQNQPAPDIIITETGKARIDDQNAHWDGGLQRELTVTLPRGIEFASTPDVDVEDGNLEIGKVSLRTNDRVLVVPIDSSSTKPSTLKISNIKLTLDRTVPEGEFKAEIGGEAIVKNDNTNATIKRPVVFTTDNVVEFVFANVITPAPGETRATSVFSIGSKTYTVIEQNESVEKTMDAAPYIKDGRTFLPLRYVANALGVDDDNIVWDQATKAVTIFKGDRIAQVTIGSKTMLVNGVTVNMDVGPEITDERTMLPIRWMGQALGATIDWDADARSVTVKQ